MAAAEAVRAAIADHQAASETGPVDGFITDFAYVAAVADPERPGRTSYVVGYHASRVPPHVALGLFNVGADLAATDDWDLDV